MAGEEEDAVAFEAFSLPVLGVLFGLATIGSAGSILLLGSSVPTPAGAVDGAMEQYLDWMRVAVAALLIAVGLDVVSGFLTANSELDVNSKWGGSAVYAIAVWSMLLVTLWNVGMLVLLPIARSIVPYQGSRYMVWTFAIRFSIDAILVVAALVLILTVAVLVLRLLLDVIVFGMSTLGSDGE
ncbi:hypothetical protein GCM10028857_19510 [Salinarchaeum chitinilyticum]